MNHLGGAAVAYADSRSIAGLVDSVPPKVQRLQI